MSRSLIGVIIIFFQPFLYQVATAVLSSSEVAAPIRQLGRKQKNLAVVLGEATGVDLEVRIIKVVSLGTGNSGLAFDHLVIAGGMQQSYFGHDEFAIFAQV